MSIFDKNNIFNIFKKISEIPRNSGNELNIKNFLIDFANTRKLNFYSDKFNNVIIFKKSCDCEPIILQAHTDMVCVKTPNSKVDFEKDGIELIKFGRYIKAKNTSLGADNGIGMAIILDILDSNIPCNIEAVFTASEETDMSGVLNIDISKLKSKKMICLDGFEENSIILSSAGFVDYLINFDNSREFLDFDNSKTYNLEITGLKGGHSGYDINKNRGSSHKLLAQLLLNIDDFNLISFNGGHNYNVIPSQSLCTFSTQKSKIELKKLIRRFYLLNKKIYKHLEIKCSPVVNQTLVLKNGRNLINFILKFEQGVSSKDFMGNLIASQNISEIDSSLGFIKIGIRSSDSNIESKLIEKLNVLSKEFLFDGRAISSQPAFNSLINSSLASDLEKSNKNQTKRLRLHIAVECGIFQKRIKDLDVVIISPTILDVHSIHERVDISSVINTSIWLKHFLTNPNI